MVSDNEFNGVLLKNDGASQNYVGAAGKSYHLKLGFGKIFQHDAFINDGACYNYVESVGKSYYK